MKKSVIILLLLFSANSHIHAEEKQQSNLDQVPRKCQKCIEKDQKEVASILASFFGVICSFFNILQAPNDKQNVRLGITGMIAGMGNIVNTAIKGGAVVQDYVESEEFEGQVKKLVATRTRSREL